MIKEEIYLNAGNTLLWILKSKDPDGQGFLATNLAAVTRMTLRFSSTLTIDSNTSPGAFDWLTANFTGELILDLGGETIPAGEYSNVWLTVYDPTNPGGVVWDRQIFFEVFA